MAQLYATGKAGHEHWGEVPTVFDERLHRLECPCGQRLYPTHSNPKEAGYRDKDKVNPCIVPLSE